MMSSTNKLLEIEERGEEEEKKEVGGERRKRLKRQNNQLQYVNLTWILILKTIEVFYYIYKNNEKFQYWPGISEY